MEILTCTFIEEYKLGIIFFNVVHAAIVNKTILTGESASVHRQVKNVYKLKCLSEVGPYHFTRREYQCCSFWFSYSHDNCSKTLYEEKSKQTKALNMEQN